MEQKCNRIINRIILHCSATKEGIDFNESDINRWHLERGWNGTGYHYIIKLDGTIEPGRPLNKIGSHCKGYNKDSIGICYIGGLDKDGNPKDTRTDKQKASMWLLIERLKKRFPNATVHGHNEFSNKSCPVFDVSKEFSKNPDGF